MKAEELKWRSKQFAIRIIRCIRGLPASQEVLVIGNQMLRSGTSVAANYRAVCRARSRAEFIAKMGVVVEEIDETVFWLELLIESGSAMKEPIEPLLREANQLLAIFAASYNTEKSRSPKFNEPVNQ